jgi:hypothetical protein
MKNHYRLMLAAGLVMANDLYRPETYRQEKPKTDYLNEYELIKKKVSRLSANERKRVVLIVETRAARA